MKHYKRSYIRTLVSSSPWRCKTRWWFRFTSFLLGWIFTPKIFGDFFGFSNWNPPRLFVSVTWQPRVQSATWCESWRFWAWKLFVCFFYRWIWVTHTDILSYCMDLYMGLHVYYGTIIYMIYIFYLHTILDGHHSWIMMRGTTSMHLQWRLLSDQQEDDHTCAHGEKFHAWLRMLKPSGIWQAITWLPGQIQFETSLQFHSFFPHSRHTFWISQVYVDESSSYLYIISEGEVVCSCQRSSVVPVVVQSSVIVQFSPLCQVMLSYHGISIETRRSLECFSEFAFLCRGLSIQMHPNAAFIRSLDRHDKVSLVQKLKWKMKYQKFKI